MSGLCDAPPSGPWDFSDQASNVKPLEEATDGVGLASALWDGCGGCEEMFTDVLVAEAHQGVFAFQHGVEEGEVVDIGGVEAPVGTSLVPAWSGQRGKAVMAGCGVWGGRERLKIVLVGCQRDFPIAVEVGHALGHGIPADHPLSLANTLAANLELPWMVDHCFYAQYAPVFVVHFYPVLTHPVFDPCAGLAFVFEVREDFALKVAVEFASQEGQDVLG